MQTKEELESFYNENDPWKYQNNPDDINRKFQIIETIRPQRFKRALDIGCGEGWITKDLPADEIFGIELSDNASTRFPSNVKRIDKPEGKYDLIICTGCLYKQYDWRTMLDWIKEHASKRVLLSHIMEWEIPELSELKGLTHTKQFKYRGYTQHLRYYDVSTTQHKS